MTTSEQWLDERIEEFIQNEWPDLRGMGPKFVTIDDEWIRLSPRGTTASALRHLSQREIAALLWGCIYRLRRGLDDAPTELRNYVDSCAERIRDFARGTAELADLAEFIGNAATAAESFVDSALPSQPR